MNMALRLPEVLSEEQMSLRDFHRARQKKPVQRRGRVVGGAMVLAAHVALVAAIIWGGSKVYNVVIPPQPITVSLLAEEPRVEIPPPPPPPKMAMPEIPVAVAPEITISTTPSAAITVQQVKNPAPVAPASPIAGTGRDAYLARIIAQLDAAKHYPPQARKLHIEGVVQLHFIMDRTGHVLSFDIAKSSGRPMLDDEARGLITRAQLPPIPAGWPQTTLNLVVPVEFELH